MDEYARELAETTARSKSNTHRIDKLEEQQAAINNLATSTAVMAQRLGTVETNVSEIKDSVDTLKEKSGKIWDGIVEKLIWLAVGGVIAFAVKAALGI